MIIHAPKSKLWLPEGNVLVEVARHGEVLDAQQVKNLVVIDGVNLLRDLLLNIGYAPNCIAVGTGSSTTTAGMDGLEVETFRKYFDRRVSTSGKATYQMQLATADANGVTLTEAGIFSGATFNGTTLTTGGTLFARTTYTGIAKDNTITVTYTWDIPITAGS